MCYGGPVSPTLEVTWISRGRWNGHAVRGAGRAVAERNQDHFSATGHRRGVFTYQTGGAASPLPCRAGRGGQGIPGRRRYAITRRTIWRPPDLDLTVSALTGDPAAAPGPAGAGFGRSGSALRGGLVSGSAGGTVWLCAYDST